MEDFLYNFGWTAALLWGVIYTSDYALTIIGAQLYHRRGKEVLLLRGSYELNPIFEKDIDALRKVSPRFLLLLIMTTLILLFLWWMSAFMIRMMIGFYFILGYLFLLEAVVHIRHIRNIFQFRLIGLPDGVKGQIEYPRWVTLRLSSAEFGSFCVLFFLLGLFLGDWFLMGGAFSCLIEAIRHESMSQRLRKGSKVVQATA